MPIQFTNGKSRIKKRRGCKNALSGYYACLSRDLLLMASGADTHTHIHQRTWMKRFQETRHTRPSATRAWFKNMIEMHTYIKQLDTFKYDSQVAVNYQYTSNHGTKDFCI